MSERASSIPIGAMTPRSLDAAATRASVTASQRDADAFSRMLASALESPAKIAEKSYPILVGGMLPLERQNKVIPLDSAIDNVMPFEMERGDKALPFSMEPEPIALGARQPVDADEIRRSAEQLVASALLAPVMEQMNASPLRPKDGPFAQTLGEKRFGPLLHQHMADRMMQSKSFGLVDAVVRQLGGGERARVEMTA